MDFAAVSRTMALDSRYLKQFQEPQAEAPKTSKGYGCRVIDTAGHAGVWKHPVPMTQEEGEEYFKEFVHKKDDTNPQAPPPASSCKDSK